MIRFLSRHWHDGVFAASVIFSLYVIGVALS